MIDANLCIFASDGLTHFLYLPPLGDDVRVTTIEACFDRLDALNTNKNISRIENVGLDQLKKFPQDKYSFYKKGYEYIYFKNDLISLTGNLYKSKRSSYNHFVKNNRYEYSPYSEDMTDDCLALYDLWSEERRGKYNEDIYCHMIEESRGVHSLAMKYYKELGLAGRVVFVDGEVKGYTFGYPLDQKVFCILFEVAALNIPGLPVFIFRQFCMDQALDEYNFINVMDDCELSNMTAVKMSFRPSIMAPLYTVQRKQ